MRIVVYDHEFMEPLTVVEIAEKFIREIERGIRPPQLYFPVMPTIMPTILVTDAPQENVNINIVSLIFEPIRKGSDSKPMMWLCTTKDGETALLLRSTFLSGQRRELQRREQKAFFLGLMTAVGER